MAKVHVHVSAQSVSIWDLKVRRPKPLIKVPSLESQGGKYMNMKGTGVSQSRSVGIRCRRGTSRVCY